MSTKLQKIYDFLYAYELACVSHIAQNSNLG